MTTRDPSVALRASRYPRIPATARQALQRALRAGKGIPGPRLHLQTAMRDSDRHGEGGRMSVTEQDRERAREIRQSFLERAETPPGLEEAIAEALADERDRARAPFLALAEELEGRKRLYDGLDAAEAIRRVAEDPQ